eukprot:scaffold144748_cov33-Tisochrysis_lutea.AAC.1
MGKVTLEASDCVIEASTHIEDADNATGGTKHLVNGRIELSDGTQQGASSKEKPRGAARPHRKMAETVFHHEAEGVDCRVGRVDAARIARHGFCHGHDARAGSSRKNLRGAVNAEQGRHAPMEDAQPRP